LIAPVEISSGTFEEGMECPVHPGEDIEVTESFAEANGWQYVASSAHARRRLFL